MPNHTYCSLKFHFHDDNGEMINKIQELIKGENGDIDFSKIIPIPENIYMGDLGRHEKLIHGENNWYDWQSKNWGTKWNAYGIKLMTKDRWKLVYLFQTAWNEPKPVIKKLFEMFDEKVNIEFICADDGGWFAKHFSKYEGKIAELIWTSEIGNDPGGKIRNALYEALNTEY